MPNPYQEKKQASRQRKKTRKLYNQQQRTAGGPRLCDVCATSTSIKYTRFKRYDGKPIWLCLDHSTAKAPKPRQKRKATLIKEHEKKILMMTMAERRDLRKQHFFAIEEDFNKCATCSTVDDSVEYPCYVIQLLDRLDGF